MSKGIAAPKKRGASRAKSSPGKDYIFENYFKSELQLRDITHKVPMEDVVEAYARLIWVYASNHVREGVELEDLVSEGRKGVCEAYRDYNRRIRQRDRKKRPNYNFHQACLYKIRSSIFQYCLRSASQIKTPYYIQRGLMHVGQILKLMSNQKVAEALLKRKGPATDAEILKFLYNEKERLPKKSMKFIKQQITKDASKKEFQQVLNGVLNHELGSRHSYVKNNLTDVGKCLHIKEKIWFACTSNGMSYKKVIDLILSARQFKVELTPNMINTKVTNMDKRIILKELFEIGKKLCGEDKFNIFIANKFYDKTYEQISIEFKVHKDRIIDIIKDCIRVLREDPTFQEVFNDSYGN